MSHKSSIEGIRDPCCGEYTVLVRYRTKSGCNAKEVTVFADSETMAWNLSAAKVRNMRGVIAIDSCEVQS